MPRSKQPTTTTHDEGEHSPDDHHIKFSDRIPPLHPNTKLQQSTRTITSQVRPCIIHYSTSSVLYSSDGTRKGQLSIKTSFNMN